MNFISLEYIIFFLVVGCLFLISNRITFLRILLVACIVYYGSWNPAYLILIAFSILVGFSTGRILTNFKPESIQSRIVLFIGIVANFSILFIFKYYNFIADLFNRFITGQQLWELNLLLPIGISFYTFQITSYLVDVYRRTIKPETSLFKFSLFVMFFPQLVAGPIERAKNLLPQFERIEFNYMNAVSGLRLILFGVFKKVVIADRLALFVNSTYADIAGHTPWQILLATYFFGFQIYFDFSGYTDIARGTARFFGINLMENFKLPYFASSFSDFWNRWHISLYKWFRDYIYIPLGGSRNGIAITFVNILIVFVVSGIWHGAGYSFILWGFFNGLLVGLNMLWSKFVKNKVKLNPKLSYVIGWFVTFNLTMLVWVFFKSSSSAQAMEIFAKFLQLDFSNIRSILAPFRNYVFFEFFIIVFSIPLAEFLNYSKFNIKLNQRLHKINPKLKFILYVLFTLLVIFLGVWNTQEFIYFQF